MRMAQSQKKPTSVWTWIASGVVIPAVLYVLAVPFIKPSPFVGHNIAANEASATDTLRTITAAETAYQSAYGAGFSRTLKQMCDPAPGGQPNVGAAGLLDPDRCGQGPNGTATSFERSGYWFTYVPASGTGKITSYVIQADPIERGGAGQRSFFVNESGFIRSNASAPATASDNPI